ncbi:hypothetical protein QYF61_024187 [Mycteria americana]|uniref:Uncharacterized protein n=1 Tax=Mycteria americana TaxID=33587 RepID=A0AAN7NYZ2_MYCAM|nr:hypothetical protein QYF61_024187 [Mycteria americana]
MIKGLEHLEHYDKKLRDLELPNLEKRRLRGDLITPVPMLDNPFMVPRDRTRGDVHKLKHRRYCLNIRKHLFTVRVTKHWHRLPKEVVECPTLETFKRHLDMVLDSLLLAPYVSLLFSSSYLSSSTAPAKTKWSQAEGSTRKNKKKKKTRILKPDEPSRCSCSCAFKRAGLTPLLSGLAKQPQCAQTYGKKRHPLHFLPQLTSPPPVPWFRTPSDAGTKERNTDEHKAPGRREPSGLQRVPTWGLGTPSAPVPQSGSKRPNGATLLKRGVSTTPEAGKREDSRSPGLGSIKRGTLRGFFYTQHPRWQDQRWIQDWLSYTMFATHNTHYAIPVGEGCPASRRELPLPRSRTRTGAALKAKLDTRALGTEYEHQRCRRLLREGPRAL